MYLWLHIQSNVDVVSVLVRRVLTCYEYVNCNMILFIFHVCFITQIRNSMNTATYVQTAVFLYSSHYAESNFYEHCKHRVLIFLQGRRQICNPIILIIEATKNEFNGWHGWHCSFHKPFTSKETRCG